MGTWGYGPFDNDAAADWCAFLDDAEPAERSQMIRSALADAAENRHYLDVHEAQVAIAAVVVVVSQRPYGPQTYVSRGPEVLAKGGNIEVANLAPLAARALDRVIDLNSEWRELWESNNELDTVLDLLAPLRAALTD